MARVSVAGGVPGYVSWRGAGCSVVASAWLVLGWAWLVCGVSRVNHWGGSRACSSPSILMVTRAVGSCQAVFHRRVAARWVILSGWGFFLGFPVLIGVSRL